MVKAILKKPLDGHPIGAEREFDQADFDTLHRMGAVREAGDPADPVDLAKAAPAPLNKKAPPVENKAAKG